MKIAIRADGGSEIGMGHIMRTLVLAKEFYKTNEVFYVCKVDNPLSNLYEAGINKIKSEGFNVVYINEDLVIEELSKIKADCLITDSYDVDENYFSQTKQIFNLTGYIDDLNSLYFNVDFIINQNINAIDFKYKVNENTKLLLGPKYVMLREEFTNISKKQINQNIKDILITVGGSDNNYVTNRILEFVKNLNYNFHVAVGPSFKNVDRLKMFENANENIKLYFNANMIELMKMCDIAISGCGSTLYELSMCGVPTLGIILAENQEGIAKKMNDLQLIKNLLWHSDLNREILIDNIKYFDENYYLRKKISVKQREIIDGEGAKRIANKFMSMSNV